MGVGHLVALAQGIEGGLLARVLLLRHLQRVDHAGTQRRQLRPPDAIEFVIEEADVEARVVDHQLGVAHEALEIGGHVGEARLVGQELVGDAMNGDGAGVDLALRVDIDVVVAAGELAVGELDAADLDHPVAVAPFEAGGFGIEHDLAHQPSSSTARPLACAASTPRRASSSARSFSA